MNQYPEIRRVLTENPLIDEIVYECKQIVKGIIIKDQERADNAETLKSLREADLYHDIQMGTDIFINYEYTYDMFMQLPSMTADRAIMYARKKLPIPEGIKPALQAIARERWLATYEDSNEYYRLLWGKPPIGDEFIYLTPEEYEMIPIESYDLSKPVHMCTNSEAEMFYSAGVIDSMKQRRPDAKYLDYLGERSIDPYKARRTPKFGLIYIPPVDAQEVANKWRERFEINRVYLLKTIYSPAYHYQSLYYDRIMMVLIILMTFDDMVTYSPEFIINRDLFDLRTIQYMFEACGVEFFPEIPIKFQKRLLKNLNRLIKYKSSSKCMVDIVSLFGYDNMELFKFYLMKTPIIDENGRYRKDTYTDPQTGKEVPDLEANYKLQFLKVPLDEIADDYIQDPFSYEDYDETVDGDIYWNGIYTKEYVKHEILKHEFDLHLSKYISIDTVYSITEMQFQTIYFMNMLLYSNVNTDMLLVEVPEIGQAPYKLFDLIIELFALNYMYQETKDTIFYDPVQSMAVLGFNFETDLAKLAQYVEDQKYTLEELGLDKFINPNPVGIRTWEQLDQVYRNNKQVYEHLVRLMNNANNYNEYKLYRKVYDSLYITRLNFKAFKDKGMNGHAPQTYTEYMKAADMALYNILNNCSEIAKPTERRIEITRIINLIVDAIYGYIDRDEFKFLFNGISTVNMDSIKDYIMKVINFFKSYKVDIIYKNTIYKFDDRLNNKVRIIDDILFKYIYNARDKVHISDAFKMMLDCNPKECVEIMDYINFDLTYWLDKHFLHDVEVRDRWRQIMILIHWREDISIRDKISGWTYIHNFTDRPSPVESLEMNIKTNPKDKYTINDNVYFKFSKDPLPLT